MTRSRRSVPTWLVLIRRPGNQDAAPTCTTRRRAQGGRDPHRGHRRHPHRARHVESDRASRGNSYRACDPPPSGDSAQPPPAAINSLAVDASTSSHWPDSMSRMPTAVSRDTVALFQRDASAAGAERAVFVTLGRFTGPAKNVAIVATPTVDLIDGQQICDLVREQEIGLRIVPTIASEWFDRFD